ncbi:MAG: GGDEF domain-containing protein [Geminicoccaceae bacterium]
MMHFSEHDRRGTGDGERAPSWPDQLIPLLHFSANDRLAWYNPRFALEVVGEDGPSWLGLHALELSRFIPPLVLCENRCGNSEPGFFPILGEFTPSPSRSPMLLYGFKPLTTTDHSYFVVTPNYAGSPLWGGPGGLFSSSPPAIDAAIDLLESLQLHEWQIDSKTARLDVPDDLADFLGFPKDPEVRGNPYIHLQAVYEADRPLVHDAGSEAIYLERPFDLTFRMRSGSGELVLARSVCRKIDSLGSGIRQITGSLLLLPNISEDIERSFTDSLTGLFNRYMFDRDLDNSHRRKRKDDRYGYALAVCDLDDLKLVNDRLGHAVGDQYLRLAGSWFQEAAKQGDLKAYRLGGDEFCLIFQDFKDFRDVEKRIEWLKGEIERAAQTLLASEFGGRMMGMSAGVTQGWGTDSSAGACYERADRLLYRDKRERKAANEQRSRRGFRFLVRNNIG